tara:strand:+ start:122 stop:487 length:366 start_codon:yes stop_codon:yes gene_type:complete
MFDDVPGDFVHGAVQAAMRVKSNSNRDDLANLIDTVLRDEGCECEGRATLAGGMPASALYHDLPYLMLSVSPERDGSIDVNLYYHREAKDELQGWIDSFSRSALPIGLTVDVYEEPSTGPF